MVLITFIHQAIVQAISMLFGATGEIMTEKSGNLNLGIPGIMYMGGIAGLMGAFFYEKGNDNPSVLTGVLISLRRLDFEDRRRCRPDFRQNNGVGFSGKACRSFADSGAGTAPVFVRFPDLYGDHSCACLHIHSEKDQSRPAADRRR